MNNPREIARLVIEGEPLLRWDDLKILAHSHDELTQQLEQAQEALKEALPYVCFSNEEGTRRAEVARMIESAQPEEERRD